MGENHADAYIPDTAFIGLSITSQTSHTSPEVETNYESIDGSPSELSLSGEEDSIRTTGSSISELPKESNLSDDQDIIRATKSSSPESLTESNFSDDKDTIRVTKSEQDEFTTSTPSRRSMTGGTFAPVVRDITNANIPQEITEFLMLDQGLIDNLANSRKCNEHRETKVNILLDKEHDLQRRHQRLIDELRETTMKIDSVHVKLENTREKISKC